MFVVPAVRSLPRWSTSLDWCFGRVSEDDMSRGVARKWSEGHGRGRGAEAMQVMPAIQKINESAEGAAIGCRVSSRCDDALSDRDRHADLTLASSPSCGGIKDEPLTRESPCSISQCIFDRTQKLCRRD